MGCCCSCCCVPDRKSRRESPRDVESRSRDSIGQPPAYDFKNPADEPGNNASYPVDKPSIDPPAFSQGTMIDDLPQQQGVRLGVRSSDHRLYQAAAGGHLDEVKRLLESGFNPSDRTVCDWSPLHWAAHNDIEHGYEIVKLLVRYGADINQVSDTGVTPLELARKAGKGENVYFLEGLNAKTGVEMREVRMRLAQVGCN